MRSPAKLARLRLDLQVAIPPEKLEGGLILIEEGVFVGALHRGRLPPWIIHPALRCETGRSGSTRNGNLSSNRSDGILPCPLAAREPLDGGWGEVT